MALDFFAGCVGGAAGLICGHPLDTVKVRLQTQSPGNAKYRGTFHALSTIVKQESVPGLYKGIVSPLYGVAVINAVVFGVYGSLRPYISGPPGYDALWAHFAAGAASGGVQSIISSPMELVKIRMQTNESVTTKSSWDVVKEIFHKEGGLRRGIFKGWSTTIAREMPGFGSYFATYELLTTRIGNGREIGTFDMLMAGGMSGVVSWIVTYPTDVVKTRIQMDTAGQYKGIVDCVKKIYQTEGFGAFTRGLSPAVLRAFPTNAATFTVVTWIMRLGERSAVSDLQTGNQTLKEYLEEWDNSTRRSSERIYQTLQYKMPQPRFLTAQCFLESSPLQVHQMELITGFSDCGDYNNPDKGMCSKNRHLSVPGEYYVPLDISPIEANNQGTGSNLHIEESGRNIENAPDETVQLKLRLAPAVTCNCESNEQCICTSL